MKFAASNIMAFAVVCATFTTWAEDGAKVTHLDASGDADAAQTIVFVGNKTSSIPTAGTAYICFVKGGTFDSAYGLHTEDDTASAGDISEAVMKKTSDAKKTTGKVKKATGSAKVKKKKSK